MIEQVRSLVRTHGRLRISIDALGDRDNLWAAGLASFAAVHLMLALEETFEIEFATPESSIFESIDTIVTNVSRLARCQPFSANCL